MIYTFYTANSLCALCVSALELTTLNFSIFH